MECSAMYRIRHNMVSIDGICSGYSQYLILTKFATLRTRSSNFNSPVMSSSGALCDQDSRGDFPKRVSVNGVNRWCFVFVFLHLTVASKFHVQGLLYVVNSILQRNISVS